MSMRFNQLCRQHQEVGDVKDWLNTVLTPEMYDMLVAALENDVTRDLILKLLKIFKPLILSLLAEKEHIKVGGAEGPITPEALNVSLSPLVIPIIISLLTSDLTRALVLKLFEKLAPYFTRWLKAKGVMSEV